MKKIIQKNKYLLLTITFIIIAFLIFGLNSFHNNIWYDEAHQMLLNRLSIIDIIKESQHDTSAPLYPIILKIVTSIFDSSLPVARLTSFGIFSIIFILSFYPIRRLYNLKTSIVFSILMLISTMSSFASIEIRTYSLSLIGTLGATVYSLLYLKENKLSDLIKYMFFSLIALYTHVYAMLSILLLIIMTTIISLLKKKGRKIIISNILLILLFVPWLNVILNSQRQRVEAEFWVTPPTLNTLFTSIKEVLSKELVISIILLLLLLTCIIISIIKKKELKSILYLLIPSIGCLAIFYIWSIYKTPLFVYKYIVPVCGIIYLIMARILTNNKIITPSIIFIILLIPNFIDNYKYEKRLLYDTETYKMIEYVNHIPKEERAFYNTFEFGLGISEYYFPNSKHYIKQDSNISLTGPNIFGELITNKIIKEKYIIVYGRVGEPEYNFIELFNQGYFILDSQTFYNEYNSGCTIYILENYINKE